MKRVDVYKLTQDCWYPEFTCEDGKLVMVSFLKTGPKDLENYEWRVCAWGNDDCGLEKDFPENQEASAWTCFLEVIGMEFVNMQNLIDLGFKSA